jgi:hypothetical protein
MTSSSTATLKPFQTDTSNPSTDVDKIYVANEHIREEQLLEAARILRQVEDIALLSDTHRRLLHSTLVIEESVQELLSPPSNEWTKQGESHGHHDFTIYYKIDTSSGAKLTCRIESPIPHSLLVPLLSVLNESDLYHKWIPSWSRPFKMGIESSKQLLHDTRGHQVIQVQCNVPWPLSPREALFDVQAVDDIAARGFILAKMRTVTEQMAKSDLPTSFTIPQLEGGTERADFDGAVLFRACPTDHPCYDSARSKTPTNEDLVLVQFSMYFDAHMGMVPQSVINFITRSAIGIIWSMLLNVAEQVRDGTRSEHCDVIAQKADFYKWVERRVDFLLNMNKNEKKREDIAIKDVVSSHPSMESKCQSIEQSNEGLQRHREDEGRSATPRKEDTTRLSTQPWTLREVLQLSI